MVIIHHATVIELLAPSNKIFDSQRARKTQGRNHDPMWNAALVSVNAVYIIICMYDARASCRYYNAQHTYIHSDD